MITPIRMQLSRAKGFRLQEASRALNGLPCVKVDRSTRFGNPFDWRDWLENAPRDALPYAWEREQWAKEQATQEFRDAIERGEHILPLEELRGVNLGCWCKGPRFSCHADVLLELANR